MNEFDHELNRRLEDLEDQGLRRRIRQLKGPQSSSIQLFEGTATSEAHRLINFSSNDYLGLANDPGLKSAAVKAVERYGSGSGASRMICGSVPPHRHLEETLASFKKTESALSFSSGYATAVGTICSLVGPDDVVILDKLVHASIVDGAHLSRAKLRVFPHNDLSRLEDLLRWARNQGGVRHALIVTESVFSMDGDLAPLAKLADLKDRFGAWLMVDEAHSTGLYGDAGRGLVHESGVAGRVEIQMGTLGKALGSAGGFICGSRALIDFLMNRARSFIFSTAPVPAAAAAARAAVEFVQSPSGAARREALWHNVSRLTNELGIRAWRSAIVPLNVGSEAEAVTCSEKLQQDGFLVPAIRYPTVRRGSARLRVTLSSEHSSAEVNRLASALRKLGLPRGIEQRGDLVSPSLRLQH